MNLRIAAMSLLAVLCLCGCAKVGTLDRPAPLFGQKAKADYRAKKAAAAAAKAKPTSEEPEPLPAEPPPEANPPVTSGAVTGQPEPAPATPPR
ncbi:MAG TPA: hypothetical protein VGI30_02670 [Caulobacteraceae bacterium]|jgi:hypothetical protein